MRFACCCFDAVKYSSKTIGSVIRQMMIAMVCMMKVQLKQDLRNAFYLFANLLRCVEA